MARVRVDCPKCGRLSAWYEKTQMDVTLRCLCGYHKVVATRIQKIVIEHRDHGPEVKLPRTGTFLHATLMATFSLRSANLAEITRTLLDQGHDFTTSDVGTYLTILRTKGLVETTENRRGHAGGSTWVLSEACKALLGD